MDGFLLFVHRGGTRDERCRMRTAPRSRRTVETIWLLGAQCLRRVARRPLKWTGWRSIGLRATRRVPVATQRPVPPGLDEAIGVERQQPGRSDEDERVERHV